MTIKEQYQEELIAVLKDHVTYLYGILARDGKLPDEISRINTDVNKEISDIEDMISRNGDITVVEEEARKTTLSITSSSNYTWANNGQTYVTSGTYFGNNENGNIQELVINITE